MWGVWGGQGRGGVGCLCCSGRLVGLFTFLNHATASKTKAGIGTGRYSVFFIFPLYPDNILHTVFWYYTGSASATWYCKD